MSRVFVHEPVELKYDQLLCETLSTGRSYVTPEGKRYPSVTTVLGILSEDHIREWRQRVGEKEAAAVSRRAAARGTAVHSLVEDMLNNREPDLESAMPLVRSSFESIRPVFEKRIGKIVLTEKPLYSDHLGAAGRVDLVAEFDGRLSIVDVKTSSRVKTRDDVHGYFMQEASYAVMFEERTGIPVDRLVTVMSVDYSEPLVFIEKRDDWIGRFQETMEEWRRRRMYGHA